MEEAVIRWDVPSSVPRTISITSPALDGVPCSIRRFQPSGWTVMITLTTRASSWGIKLHGQRLHITVKRENMIWTMCGEPDVETWTSQGWHSDAWWIDLRVPLLPTKAWRRS